MCISNTEHAPMRRNSEQRSADKGRNKNNNGYTTILRKQTRNRTIVIMPSRWYRSKDTLKTQLKSRWKQAGVCKCNTNANRMIDKQNECTCALVRPTRIEIDLFTSFSVDMIHSTWNTDERDRYKWDTARETQQALHDVVHGDSWKYDEHFYIKFHNKFLVL